MTSTRRALLQVHFCVVVWGFTAILGKLITLPALPLVWWRMVIVTVALLVIPNVRRGLRAASTRVLLAYAGVGIVLSLHWVTFYASIKLSNASVGATSIAMAPLFLALLEPFLASRKFVAREVIFGIAVIPGVALVVGGLPSGMRGGVAMGALSALLVAIFASLNKRLVHHAHAMVMTCAEIGAGAIFLTVAMLFLPHHGPTFPLPTERDSILLVVLAVGCTLLPFVLALMALRHLTAFGAQLVVNLEPVYAILLAIPLLGEQRELGASFYLGVLILLTAVFANPLAEHWGRARASFSEP